MRKERDRVGVLRVMRDCLRQYQLRCLVIFVVDQHRTKIGQDYSVMRCERQSPPEARFRAGVVACVMPADAIIDEDVDITVGELAQIALAQFAGRGVASAATKQMCEVTERL